jgi:recombination protein RecA
MAKEGDIAYGNTTKVKATKNKMCPPYRIAQFDVVWGKGIDKFAEVIDLAIEYDIITKAGSWFSYGETKIGQGKTSVISILNDNPELFDEIRQLLIDKLTHTEDLPTDEISEEEIVMTMTNI